MNETIDNSLASEPLLSAVGNNNGLAQAQRSAWLAIESNPADSDALSCDDLLALGEKFMDAGRVEQAVIAFAIGGCRAGILRCAQFYEATGDQVAKASALDVADSCDRFSSGDLQELGKCRR